MTFQDEQAIVRDNFSILMKEFKSAFQLNQPAIDLLVPASSRAAIQKVCRRHMSHPYDHFAHHKVALLSFLYKQDTGHAFHNLD